MMASAVAAAARLVCGPTVIWHCDPDSPAQRIYFANHASHLDFVVLWASLPGERRAHARPVAGRDYWERTALRRYMARAIFRAILIDRPPAGAADRTVAARQAVAYMASEMGRDTSVIVFPEGTRSVDGTIGPFKSGLYHLAGAVPGAELVPVHLHNLNRILPRGETLPVPMLSRVTFGTPLRVDDSEPKDAFLGRARAAIDALKDAA
jgi:1-acyl-sn-glycerol-3-phosphate acyltransferase